MSDNLRGIFFLIVIVNGTVSKKIMKIKKDVHRIIKIVQLMNKARVSTKQVITQNTLLRYGNTTIFLRLHTLTSIPQLLLKNLLHGSLNRLIHRL